MGKSRTPQCPPLPPELWLRILSSHTDLTHLWTACRHVSTSFRAQTEHVFSESILRDTFIDFQLEKYNLGGKSKRPEIPTSFSHFEIGAEKDKDRDSVNKAIACFKDSRSDIEVGKNGVDYEATMERWESNVAAWKAEMPNYTIRVGNLVNDTELPGLSMDRAARQIRFDWRQAFTFFFREQRLLRNLMERWKAESEEALLRNKERLARGESLLNSYPVPLAAAEVEMRVRVRRKRLREYYEGDEEMVWAVESLRCFENHGGAGGSGRAFRLNPDVPGAGLGERFFGSVYLVQELYLDEWSCMHRIDVKAEQVKSG